MHTQMHKHIEFTEDVTARSNEGVTTFPKGCRKWATIVHSNKGASHVNLVVDHGEAIIYDVPCDCIKRDVVQEVRDIQNFITERILVRVKIYEGSGGVSLNTSTKDIISAAMRDVAEEYQVDKKEVENLLKM